jgi:cytochrome P450
MQVLFFHFFVLLLAAILIIFIIGYSQTRRVYNIKTGEMVPGNSIFFLPWFLFKRQNISIWRYNHLNNKHLGPIISNFTFHKMFLMVRDAKLANIILKDTNTFLHQGVEIVPHTHKFVGDQCLAMVNGEVWKRQRQILDPPFRNLENYFPIFLEKTSETLNLIQDQTIIPDIKKFIKSMALDILGLSIFGYDFNCLKNEENKNLKAYVHLMETFFNFEKIYRNMFTHHFDCFNSTKETLRQLEIWSALRSELIEKSKEKILKKEGKPSEYSLLDLMVEFNLQNNVDEKLSDKEVMDNVGLFFLVGHENTSNALAFSVYCLARYPEIQSKLRKEIFEKIDKINSQNIETLEYMNCFIKELMRLYTPLANIPAKITSKEVILGDYFIPKGTLIRISILDIHTNEEFYESPLEFKPERWLESDKKKIPHYAWIPFSGGPRVCIGTRFSIMQQKIFLTQLLMKFEVSMVDQGEVEIDPLLETFQSPKKMNIKFNFYRK